MKIVFNMESGVIERLKTNDGNLFKAIKLMEKLEKRLRIRLTKMRHLSTLLSVGEWQGGQLKKLNQWKEAH